MRTNIAALSVALLAATLVAPLAQAAPTEVDVRIEGKTETLFEGPILTDGRQVEASSDGEPRRCDGVNNGKHPDPGPTPTAASVDAMSILGEGFDGEWYPGYDDYFITRWGPGEQDVAHDEYWGLVVNNVYTNVGGCQYQLDGGDEVLWAYDAFKDKPLLALFPADYAGGAKPLTATAELDQPFEVEVDSYEDNLESVPPAAPERTGANPFAGAAVAPVKASASGFERVDTGDPVTRVTGAGGRATLTFSTYGWHRIKATRVGPGGKEDAIRSNRLDVCVPEPSATGCQPASLPDDLARTPPPPKFKEPQTPKDPGGDGGGTNAQSASGPMLSPSADDLGQVRLQLPRIDRSRLARGLVKLSWRVLDHGVGLARWTISSKALGRRAAAIVVRARGSSATSATLRLPAGGAYQLQIAVVDVLGRSSTAVIGRVQVPA